MTSSNSHLHHRRSIRLKGYDYTLPGAYFITLVTWQRDCLFGTLTDGKMQLSALGKIVQDEWMRSILIRKEILIHEDEYVIMPNHLHAIVWIVPPDDIPPVGADGVRPNDDIQPTRGACHPAEENAGLVAPLQRKPRSLSSFVAGFKAAVTSRAKRELAVTAVWQRNYYDHIIRNDQDFINIWEYIDTNPQRWQEDQLHPSLINKGASLAPQQINQE
jgi:putative transposase